jgi:DNA recombination-dependent growth factor C
MGFLSPTSALTRYRVEGRIPGPVLEAVREGLTAHRIDDIDNGAEQKSFGWTRIDHPFQPQFDDSSFAIGDMFVFALRIDKKSIPPKVVKKHLNLELARRKLESGRDFLSRSEKQMAKEHVLNVLSLRIPAVPNVFDVVWHHDAGELWCFSTQKAANDTLETLFTRSFKLTLIRLFPYTLAELRAGLSSTQRDVLEKLTPTHFAE